MLRSFKVHKSEYHRNGISGIGFYAIKFSYEEEGKKRHGIATVNSYDVDMVKSEEPHDPDTRILMLNKEGEIDIREKMRGDHFHEVLCNWIIKDRSH